MKSPSAQKSSLFRGALVATAALILALSAGICSNAEAATAAGAVVTNTVTVNYKNSANVDQTAITKTATVTVQLVKSAPAVILASAGVHAGLHTQPADYNTLESTAVTVYFMVSSAANGSDDYTLDKTISKDVNLNNDIAAISISPVGPITLGATAASDDAASGATTLVVPYDGTNDSACNDIVAGDYVYINGTIYRIAAAGVVEDAASNTTTLTLTTALTGNVSAGDQIGELKEIGLNLTTGTLVSDLVEGEYTTNLKATNSAAATTTSGDAKVTVQSAALDVSKEVSVNSGPYATSGTGKSGDTLTYQIIVANNGSSNANSVVITDPIPDFTTYQTGTATATAPGTLEYCHNATCAVADWDTDDTITPVTRVRATYPTLAPAASKTLEFDVKID